MLYLYRLRADILETSKRSHKISLKMQPAAGSEAKKITLDSFSRVCVGKRVISGDTI